MNWPAAEPDQKRPEGQDTPEGQDAERRTRVAEDIFILLCVLSLWPVILGWQHVAYQALLYVALAGLVFILVRRVRRFTRAREAASRD